MVTAIGASLSLPLRLAVDANGNLMTVTFHMAGVALEFPTAPKDAFLVANQAFVAQQTGNDNISYVLAQAPGREVRSFPFPWTPYKPPSRSSGHPSFGNIFRIPRGLARWRSLG
jgi:hypothetical protein